MEDPAFERERLIGADAVSVRTHRADCERLGFGQLHSQIFKRAAAGEIAIFDARSSTFGATDSASSPAAENKARRLSLLEARIRGPAPRHSGGQAVVCITVTRWR